MWRRLGGLIETVRPRTLAQAAKSVQHLLTETREMRRSLKELQTREAHTRARAEELAAAVDGLQKHVKEIQLREAQLRAIYKRDRELERELERLPAILDADAISEHLQRAITAATLQEQPFPHMVVENVWPASFYDALVKGIPPLELFADRPLNHQRVVVPFDTAPVYGRRVWGFLTEHVLDRKLAIAVVERFSEPLDRWLASDWGMPGLQPSKQVRFQTTDGRILLRTRGYRISPHRDPKWGFITCLMYLARPGDRETWGTQLFSVADDGEAADIAPHWIRPERCRLEKEVPFRPNTMLVFLNSHGAHGAQIPADAEPEDLERYIYQFRIGPTPGAIRDVMRQLPEERRSRWAGKVADYA